MDDERYAPDTNIHNLSAAPKKPRVIPNILVTGVPGAGKSTLCTLLVDQLNSSLNQALSTQNKTYYHYIATADVINENKLWEGWDEKNNCSIFDADRTVDFMEDVISQGGKIVEFHTIDFFPERWFDLVVLVRVDNEILGDRLEKRGYHQEKITGNSKGFF